MGDVKSIAISHTDNTSFYTTNHQFTLSNTLCASVIKLNFISVNQFYQNNNMSIEFFPSFFHVKDRLWCASSRIRIGFLHPLCIHLKLSPLYNCGIWATPTLNH